MKVKVAIVLSVILFGIVPLVLMLGIGAFLGSNTPTTVCIDSGSTQLTAQNVSDNRLTVKDETIDEEQRKNAAIIVSVALENDLPPAAAVDAIVTAIQESVLRNIPYGYPGTSAVGLFSQQDAWGPFADRTNPEKSAYMFYFGGQAGQSGLTDVDNWQQMTPGEAAQAVQRSNPLGSGNPVRDHAAAVAAYEQWEPEARAIVASFSSDEDWVDIQAISAECGIDPIEAMVQAALSRVGQPVNAIVATEGSFRIGTYNVRGSNHTGHESAMQRAVTQSALIKELSLGVVGLQELRPDQRNRLMELLGDSYAIFPKTEIYGAKQTSANSIIVDTTQFKYISDRSTPMPYYFHSQELDIPLVELQHIDSGLEITVINTHDPAKPIWDRLRYLNAEAHADLVDRLSAQGKTVFFTGDFNSGFKVRDSGNTTYQNLRPNLTWCIMTRSGVQNNGYDDVLGRSGCPMATSEEMGEGPVDHVYVPRDGVTTVDHTIVREGTASDHPVVYVDVAIDGVEPSVEGDVMSTAEFISWAANEGGMTLPDTLSGLSEYESGPGDSVSSELLPLDTERIRGDITLWSTDEDPDPEQAGIEVGAVGAGEVDDKELTSAVGLKGKQVELVQVDSRKVVAVLRLILKSAVNISATDKDGWVFPLRPGASHYSDAYGLRDGRFHNGADFGTSGASPPLYAMHGGTILNVGWGGAWGNYLFVETGVPVSGSPNETYKYLYAHLSSIAPELRVGGSVVVGQNVGAVGDTGNSFGEHLHLTICTDIRCLEGSGAGSAGSVDPIPFMEALGIWPQLRVA